MAATTIERYDHHARRRASTTAAGSSGQQRDGEADARDLHHCRRRHRRLGRRASSTIGADPTTDPARVLIFNTDNTTDPTCNSGIARCAQGRVELSGQSSLKMWGLDSGPWRGLLLWNDGDGSESGGSHVDHRAGSIWTLPARSMRPAPTSRLEGNGSSDLVLAVQIISWTWDIGGNGDLYMPYDPSQLYRITATRAGPLGPTRRARADPTPPDGAPAPPPREDRGRGGRADRQADAPTRRAMS